MSTVQLGSARGGIDDPRPSRPRLPASYGVPQELEGALPWAHADERLAGARNYWVGTTGVDGAPHAVPVWGVWENGRLYFGMDPQTLTARNLERNPAVAVHLESGDDVVIFKGAADVVTDRALLKRLAAIGAVKYGGAAEAGDDAGDAGAGDDMGGVGSGDEAEGGPSQRVFAVLPRTAYAWNDFPRNMARWRFPRE